MGFVVIGEVESAVQGIASLLFAGVARRVNWSTTRSRSSIVLTDREREDISTVHRRASCSKGITVLSMTKVSAISIGKHAQLLKKTGIAGSAITAIVAVITGIAIVAGNTSRKKSEG